MGQMHAMIEKLKSVTSDSSTGGQYTFTFVSVDTGERIILKKMTFARLNIDIDDHHVYDVEYSGNKLTKLVKSFDSIDDYMSNQPTHQPINYTKNVKQSIAKVYSFIVLTIALGVFSFIGYMVLTHMQF